jgi:hypothetical protein
MKQFATITILILLITSFSVSSFAQVRVTGHVFAEVVEAVGATSVTNNAIQMQQQAVSNNFDMGEITLSGGALAACDVMITTSELEGLTGSRASFAALPENQSATGMLDQYGKQVIRLSGQAGEELLANPDKAYAAQYNVVFAYN